MKLLIVDDVELNQEILAEIFEEDFETITAYNGEEALGILKTDHDEIAAVLLDLFMPRMNGSQLLEKMEEEGWLGHIPVLMISSDDTDEAEKECFNHGAVDFIRKPFNGKLVRARVKNAVNLYGYKNHLEEKVDEQTQMLRDKNHCIVEIIGSLVESRNLESGEHVQRVKRYTQDLAKEMQDRYPEYGLTDDRIDVISEAAALHDIGKIAISDTILLKPGKLDKEEFDKMKTHTTQGAELIAKIQGAWDSEYGQVGYEIAKYHHERYDGRGYPEGLKGDEIPISAQLVSIADVFDALIHKRCYKDAFAVNEAYSMIINGECGVFSPKLIECFKACYPF